MQFSLKGLFTLLCMFSFCTNALAQALNDTAEVLLIKVGETLPEGAKQMGDIKIQDGGFKIKCGYDRTIEQAKEKARKKGANILLITELKAPDSKSTCYRLKADVYYAENIAGFKPTSSSAFDSTMNAIVPADAPYALVCVYRPKGSNGMLVHYNLNVGDSADCRMWNGSKYSVKIYKPGPLTVWAQTESREEITLNVQPGKVYFVKCSVKMGIAWGRPKFVEVDSHFGLPEFNAVEMKGDPNKQGEPVYK